MAKHKTGVENLNTPGRTSRANAEKYRAMRRAMRRAMLAVLAVLPQGAPGLSAAELNERARPLLPEALFRGGATAGWWVKCVHLDLEAKRIIERHATKPLTFSRQP